MELREILNQLEIKERRFYKILALYKKDKANFSIDYGRDHANYRITGGINDVIKSELEKEKAIIENKAICVTEYNYSAI